MLSVRYDTLGHVPDDRCPDDLGQDPAPVELIFEDLTFWILPTFRRL